MPKPTLNLLAPTALALVALAQAACAGPYDPAAPKATSAATGGSETALARANDVAQADPAFVPASANTDAGAAGLKTALAKTLPPGMAISNVRPSPVPGLYEVTVDGQLVYASADGKYLVQGDVLEMSSQTNLTERARDGVRKALLAQVKPADTIDFGPPQGTPVKHTVYVFTDVDCGYCRKLHSEINDYTGRGIKVRYLAFPRTGPGSPSAKKFEAVYCSANRQQALTEAKQDQPINAAPCPNPVNAEYKLGTEMGVRGTPMIVLENGETIAGYVPAARLEQVLNAPSPGTPAPAGAAP